MPPLPAGLLLLLIVFYVLIMPFCCSSSAGRTARRPPVTAAVLSEEEWPALPRSSCTATPSFQNTSRVDAPAAPTSHRRGTRAPTSDRRDIVCTRWSATRSCQYGSKCHFMHS
jgi:hypothetical protein